MEGCLILQTHPPFVGLVYLTQKCPTHINSRSKPCGKMPMGIQFWMSAGSNHYIIEKTCRQLILIPDCAPLLLLPMSPCSNGLHMPQPQKAVMMCAELCVNGRQAVAVWRGRDRQLCVSNASTRIWVTLTPLILPDYFTYFYNLTNHFVPAEYTEFRSPIVIEAASL